MEADMMRAETLAFYRKLKEVKELAYALEQDILVIEKAETKEFIHIFTELTQALHTIDTIHQQMIPRAEYMAEHKDETMRKLRKAAIRLVK